MEEYRKYTEELKELSNTLRENIKEDMQLWRNELTLLSKRMSSDHNEPEHPSRKFIAVVPLPREIHIEEQVKFENGSYHVTFSIKCGLRIFTTTCYLGDKADVDKLALEMKRCIDNAITSCLEYDRGHVQEMCESGKVISIQSL